MKTFFLGTHMVNWLAQTSVPLFVSHQRLKDRKRLPRALGSWALDSGGFSELNLRGGWTITAVQYALAVYRYRDEIGGLQWAAIQDWMCEPWILRKTGKSIAEHQALTVRSLQSLRDLAHDLPWAPVLQGFALDDYLRCVELYDRAGFDLTKEPIVGVGSICRRQATGEAVQILTRLSGMGLRLHGFGFKTLGLARVDHLLASSDSMAWSFNARKHPPLPGHKHRSCANCLEFALLWRTRLLSQLQRKAHNASLQMRLW